MALLDYTDLEKQKNITLTDPNGVELANKLASGILSWAEHPLGYPLATGTVVDDFDQGGSTFCLTNTNNVSGVEVSACNSVSGS